MTTQRLLAFVAMSVVLVVAILGGVAQAQPGTGNGSSAPPRIRVVDPSGARVEVAGVAEGADPSAPKQSRPRDRDRTHSSGPGMALLFWLLAFGAVGGSIFVITRRNLIAAVMGMVGTFFAIAALYMMLYADFLAVIQMLVYAGAIMVLFVFVIMILNKPEDEPWALVGIPGKALAGVAMLYLTVRLGQTLWAVEVPDTALAAPPAQEINVGTTPHPATGRPVLETETVSWGSTAAVGKNLFTEYLFPFEAVSILLLIAVVGAIAVARPFKEGEGEVEPEPPESEVAS